MNNKYDRDEAPKTYDEMVAAGYQMTDDGFWVPQDEHPEVTDFELAEPEVNLFLLKSGETLISEYRLSLTAQAYFLNNPRVVTLEDTTVSFTDWMPLSKERDFTVSQDWVVCRSNPLDTLVESYRGSQNG